jgi:hypothetical protein
VRQIIRQFAIYADRPHPPERAGERLQCLLVTPSRDHHDSTLAVLHGPQHLHAEEPVSRRRTLEEASSGDLDDLVHLPGPDFELQEPDDHVPTSYVTTSVARLVAAGKVAVGARRIG